MFVTGLSDTYNVENFFEPLNDKYSLLTAQIFPLSDKYSSREIIAPLSVFLNSLFVMGLTGLARKLQDPYGSDIEDLSVLYYVEYSILMSSRMIIASNIGQKPPDKVQEDMVANKTRILLGYIQPDKIATQNSDETVPFYELGS